MNGKRIRHLTEDREGFGAFIYFVGQERRLPISGKSATRTITEIELCDAIVDDIHFKIYISNGAVAQEWINIPKTNKIKVEFFID